jgi:hypothetical protein
MLHHHRAAAVIAALMLSAGLTACSPQALTEENVTAFVDRADDAARKRFAPEICELRGKNFVLRRKLEAARTYESGDAEISRKLYCDSLRSFSRLYQYVLERKSLKIQIAPGAQMARIEAEYVQKLPYYQDSVIPASPDNYYEVQILESSEVSAVAIEDGKIVFVSTDANVRQTLVPKHELPLPYN